MRALLGALGVLTLSALLGAASRAADSGAPASPSPSPSPQTKASPGRAKSFNDDDLARYKAMRASPSPAPQEGPSGATPSPRAPQFAPMPGTAATGSRPPPRQPAAPPRDSGSAKIEGPGPSPQPQPSGGQPQTTEESGWRQRVRAAHTAVNNARAQVKQAESEANSLFTQQLQSTDTNEIMRLRQAVADATTRAEAAKLAVTDAEDALGKLEEEARQAGIPPGWLRDDDRSSP